MASSVLNLVHGERCIVWFHHSIWDLEVQMWKQSQSYFVSILTDLDVLTWLPQNKQMHAAPPLQNVNWFLVWGKLLCYENNLKPKDLVLCVARKSTKQEQIGGNWSATLLLYPYTVYSSSALEIPSVKELHWRCSWCGLGTPRGSEKLRWGKQRIQTLLW